MVAGLLAACGGPPATPPPDAQRREAPAAAGATAPTKPAAPASTTAPDKAAAPAPAGGEVVVSYITELWNWQKLNMATATDQYNQENRGKVRIQVDPSPDGWQTKVVEMQQADNLVWDGMLRVNSMQGFPYFSQGIMQPVAPYIQSSSVAWARQFNDELLPNVKESFTLEGELYYLPWDTEVFVRHYNVEQWAKLDGKPAETLEDYEKQMLEYQKLYPDKTPLGMAHSTNVHNGDFQMLAQLWQPNPWKLDGETHVPDVRGEGFQQYMQLLRRWYEQKIITSDSWGQAQTNFKWTDPWLKQEIGSLMTGAAWGFAQARQIYGQAAIDAVPTPVLKAGDTPKTFTFSNSASLFKDAKHPQQVIDWLLWMVDPTQTKPGAASFTTGYLNYYHLPVYKTTYAKVVGSNPQWQWIEQMQPMIEASTPIPPQAFVTMWRDVMVGPTEAFVTGKATLEETVKAIEADGKAALDQVMKK
jgi:hypothetical protein